MSYLTGAINAQSLNGILTITDGVITISEGTISGLEEIDLNDLQVADTATIENLVVNNQIDMTSGKITNLANGTNANDAVNKSQLDLKADITYVDTNFLNKTTATTQNIASKIEFNNSSSDVSNPVIQLLNSTAGITGEFIRFRKILSQTANLEIGGLSFCSNNFTNTLLRQADIICSMNTNILPQIDFKFIDGTKNPLTINDGQFISRNNKQYFQKQDGTNIFNYLDYLDYVTFSKDISLGGNKIINLAEPTLAQDASTKYYTDNHSNNGNYLLRNGTLPMTGNLQMGSYKITNLLECDDPNDGVNKFYCDTQTANTHYLLRNGTLAMTGNLNLSTHNLITTGSIDCNIIDANGDIDTTSNMSCADFTSNGNQVIGGSSVNVLDVKSSAFFQSSVLIETNKHLAFNSGTLSTTNGMLMNYDGGVGFLDVRGSEFRIRTASTGTPSSIRFKVNDTNTTVLNNFFVNGSTTLGDTPSTDEAKFNCKATFPSGSELRFNSGADIIYDNGAESIFSSGSITQFNYGSTLRFLNVQSFNVGSYINSARINLISKTSDFTLDFEDNFENGCICDQPSGVTLNITMPNTGGPSGASGQYWRRRNYIIKVRERTVKLKQNTTTLSTKIDEFTSDITYTTDYKTINLVFDEDYHQNGQIWIISDR